MEKIEEATKQPDSLRHPEMAEMEGNIIKRAKLLGEDNRILLQEVLKTGWDPERVQKVVVELKDCDREIEGAKRQFLKTA